MFTKQESHKALNTYVYRASLEDGAQPEYLDNVVGYEETDTTLSLEFKLPNEDTTSWFLKNIKGCKDCMFAIVRTSGGDDDYPIFTTEHHVVENIGYSISGKANKDWENNYTIVTVHLETVASLRIDEEVY